LKQFIFIAKNEGRDAKYNFAPRHGWELLRGFLDPCTTAAIGRDRRHLFQRLVNRE
jgi:hypothetical protein